MRPALAILVALACSACRCESRPAEQQPPAPTAAIDAATARGGRFLAGRQRDDGAIPSTTYAALDAWSLTPLAALALRFVPEEAASYRRAVEFIATVAAPDLRAPPEVTYPLHAYAIGALVLGAPDNRQRHAATHGKLLAALRTLQLADRNGWRPDDVSYGGWGYAPRPVQRPDDAMAAEAYAANLSATLLAIGALALGGTRLDDPALVAARRFVERCQNLDGDGGFFFSPGNPDGNKAGGAERRPPYDDPGSDRTGDASSGRPSGPTGALRQGRYRSYGSMSADGFRALFRLGVPAGDPRAAAVTGYFTRTFDATRNPGDFPPIAEVRRASSYYYWAWSAAHVIRHTANAAQAKLLADELLRRQSADGSWTNTSSEMREDDPVIATSLAVAALAISRSVISGEPRSHAY